MAEKNSKVFSDPCPYCSSPRVRWDSHYQDYGDYNQVIRYQICKECKQRWEVVFKPFKRTVRK